MRQLETIEQYVRIGREEGADVVTGGARPSNALAARIKTGQVYVSTYAAGGGVELPFGGYRKSGYGREKGLEALASYTHVKNVCIKYE